MSGITNVTQTRNQLHSLYNTAKFLLGFNSFISAEMTAAAGDGVLTEGLVMGRISATQKIVPLDKDATDGSQYPVGIVIEPQTIANGVTASVVLVNKGRVAESLITFKDGAMTTPIGVANHQKILRDHLGDMGFELMGGEELTGYDNQ
jgi:hypothetical protein